MRKHISCRYFKSSPEIVQLFPKLPMASRLERLSFDILLPGVRRAALPQQSTFLFAITHEKDCAIPRNPA